jgi:pseudouridine-5'-phosphate glycosidase
MAAPTAPAFPSPDRSALAAARTGDLAPGVDVAEEVAEALAQGRPVVALESTIISHGLPRPANLETALEIEDTVRREGAVPATIAVIEGRVKVGLDKAQVEAIATRDDVLKVSVRDLGTLMARGGTGATTVASTSHIALLSGISVFATGGLGGVHREARESWDESADLTTLGVTPVTVVCAGVKSILDVPATLERLETLNVAVVGFGTDRFPGFYLTDSGQSLDWRVDTPDEVAAVMAARAGLSLNSALIVANPLPPEDALDGDLHDRVLDAGLEAAARAEVRGKDVTPFLLDFFHRETSGASLEANVTIVLRNAALAARIAAAHATRRTSAHR